jgi:hypothetical protein
MATRAMAESAVVFAGDANGLQAKAAAPASIADGGDDCSAPGLRGLTAIRGAHIGDLIVSALPRHGTVWPDGAMGLIYRSDRDFHGEDYFSIARQNRSDPGRHQIAIAITVKVN